ncbi:hypothetical protein N182_34020 [Sinorhizobium sp. GL2]|nr:hypothetical protein N182_34020 [Sinorhizobium sp. GL2]
MHEKKISQAEIARTLRRDRAISAASCDRQSRPIKDGLIQAL